MIKSLSGGDTMKNKALAADPVPSALPCARPGRCLLAKDFGASDADPVMSFPSICCCAYGLLGMLLL